MGCGASKQTAEGVVDENTQSMAEVQNKASQADLATTSQSETMSSKGGIAFEITLDDPKKAGSLPSLQGAAAAADKLKNADSLFSSQAHKKSNSALDAKAESTEDIEALKQRIEEKEAQAAANREKQLEKLQEKLAKADEHVKEVQERKKQQSQASLKDEQESQE